VFHNNQYSVMMAERLTHTKQVENKRKSSFLYIDQDGFRAGVKTVVIFLILMFGEVAIGLPGGGQVVFFAILFGVIPNLGQAFMKSRYGIIGVVLGITFCFISIMVISISPHFSIVIALYSLATFIAAYIASSSKDIAVSGLQAGLLFPFGLLLTTGPNLDISDAFTRFLALFSAVFIGLIVQHLLWPTNPYSLLKEKISKSIRISGEIISDLITLKTENEEKAQKLILPLAAVLPTSTQLLHDAEYVIRSNELHAEEIIHIIESIEFMYADLETLNRTIIQFKDKSSMEDFITNLDSRYRQITELFEDVSGQFNSKHNFCDQINDLKTDIEEHVHEYRKEGSWRNFDPKDVENQVLVHTSMLSLLDSLYKISSEIDKINQNKILVQGALNPREA
ncbi:MAG: FUSC family protein, partial [Thermodesulfobacteriota bacterium]